MSITSKRKPTFKYNKNNVKASSDMYRNINGIHYVHYTSDPSEFEDAKMEAIYMGLKTIIIKGEMLIEEKKYEYEKRSI
jgi:hypothetical protein